MDNLLLRFNGDEHTKEALKTYITNFIALEGLNRMYDRKDVSHIADAKELIDKAFEQLEYEFGISIQEKEVTNEAR